MLRSAGSISQGRISREPPNAPAAIEGAMPGGRRLCAVPAPCPPSPSDCRTAVSWVCLLESAVRLPANKGVDNQQ